MMSSPRSAALLALITAALAASAAVAVVAPVERADEEVRRLYEAWRSEHGRPRCDCNRAGEEDRLRLEVFRANLRYIDAHNAEADAGLHAFRLGLTPFADLTLQEFVAPALGFRNATAAPRAPSTRYLPRAGDELPDAVDWRLKGAVTEVKNQRHCGSCTHKFFGMTNLNCSSHL
jgi:cathepsin L